MSIQILSAVKETALPAQRKLILLSLADYANSEGCCWPSQPVLARDASISERNLRVHLHALEAEGWFTVVEPGNGRGRATQYRLNVDRIRAAKADPQGSSFKGPKGGCYGHLKADLGVEKADAATPKGGCYGHLKADPWGSAQPSLDPSFLEPSSKNRQQRACARKAAAAADSDEAIGRLCRAWEKATGTMVTPMLGDTFAEFLEIGISEEWVSDAIAETGGNGSKSPKYLKAIVERWQLEGRAPPLEELPDGTAAFAAANADAQERYRKWQDDMRRLEREERKNGTR